MAQALTDIQSQKWRIADSENMARESQTRFIQEASGRCQSPVMVEAYARPRAKNGARDVVIAPGTAHSILIESNVRCRRCRKCLAARGALWRARAITETRQAVRTWFSTLTLTPENQTRYLEAARSRLGQQGLDFDALDFGDQFRTRVSVIGPELQKFLKRLRKELPDGLRFLMIAEHHKSGSPHFHALFHEQDPNRPLRKAVLEDQWRLGFSQHRLVKDTAQAVYLCKYLSKALAARVRASQCYGAAKNTPMGIANLVGVYSDPTPTQQQAAIAACRGD